MFTMQGIWSGSGWRMACTYLGGAAGLDLRDSLLVTIRNLAGVQNKAKLE